MQGNIDNIVTCLNPPVFGGATHPGSMPSRNGIDLLVACTRPDVGDYWQGVRPAPLVVSLGVGHFRFSCFHTRTIVVNPQGVQRGPGNLLSDGSLAPGGVVQGQPDLQFLAGIPDSTHVYHPMSFAEMAAAPGGALLNNDPIMAGNFQVGFNRLTDALRSQIGSEDFEPIYAGREVFKIVLMEDVAPAGDAPGAPIPQPPGTQLVPGGAAVQLEAALRLAPIVDAVRIFYVVTQPHALVHTYAHLGAAASPPQALILRFVIGVSLLRLFTAPRHYCLS